jgi:hypothetical protein
VGWRYLIFVSPNSGPTAVGTFRRLGIKPMAASIRKRPDKGSDAFEPRVFLGRDASGRVRHQSQRFRGNQSAAERPSPRWSAD